MDRVNFLRLTQVSSIEEIGETWKALLADSIEKNVLYELAKQTLTTREGLFIVWRMRLCEFDDDGEQFNPIFQALAEQGTIDEMLTCVQLREALEIEEDERMRNDPIWALVRDRRDEGGLGDYYSWLWPAILEKGGPRSVDEVFLILRSIYRHDSPNLNEHGEGLYSHCLTLLLEGEGGREEFRATDEQLKRYRAYFDDFGRMGDEETMEIVGRISVQRTLAGNIAES